MVLLRDVKIRKTGSLRLIEEKSEIRMYPKEYQYAKLPYDTFCLRCDQPQD